MLLAPSPKQKELNTALIEKTKADKIDWKLGADDSFFVRFGEFLVTVSRTMGYESSPTIVVQEENELITRFIVENSPLHMEAQIHCQERNDAITAVIKALEKL